MSKSSAPQRPQSYFSITLNDDGSETVEDFGPPLAEHLPDAALRPFVELVLDQIQRENEVASLSVAA